MIYKNICTKRTWKDGSGNTKTKWLRVGTFKINDNGKEFIDLNMFPDTAFYVFEQEDRNQAEAPTQESDVDLT